MCPLLGARGSSYPHNMESSRYLSAGYYCHQGSVLRSSLRRSEPLADRSLVGWFKSLAVQSSHVAKCLFCRTVKLNPLRWWSSQAVQHFHMNICTYVMQVNSILVLHCNCQAIYLYIETFTRAVLCFRFGNDSCKTVSRGYWVSSHLAWRTEKSRVWEICQWWFTTWNNFRTK